MGHRGASVQAEGSGPEGDAEVARGLLQGGGGARGLEVTGGVPCRSDPPHPPLQDSPPSSRRPGPRSRCWSRPSPSGASVRERASPPPSPKVPSLPTSAPVPLNVLWAPRGSAPPRRPLAHPIPDIMTPSRAPFSPPRAHLPRRCTIPQRKVLSPGCASKTPERQKCPNPTRFLPSAARHPHVQCGAEWGGGGPGDPSL